MRWIPELSLQWLHGWSLLSLYLAVMFIQPLFYPNRKQVMTRLMTHPRDTGRVRKIMPITMFFYYLMLLLTLFFPVVKNHGLLIPGLSIFACFMILYALAVHAFATTPLDEPVVKGPYRISRNPIHFFSWVAYFGIGMAVGSWEIILINAVTAIGIHIGTLAEERFCLDKYGEAYAQYMKRAPRYCLFF
ncbi:isoprenylcysteine carboxylmethyltransferase family protein [bacterium]|nr:isoprenylcysteine carboxylmethyltransferase family protein [bacterium]